MISKNSIDIRECVMQAAGLELRRKKPKESSSKGGKERPGGRMIKHEGLAIHQQSQIPHRNRHDELRRGRYSFSP